MREKEKLNLTALDDQIASSKLRKALIIGTKAAGGASTGLAATGLVVSMLAVAGITVAVLYELVAGAAGAAIFGGLAVGLAAYQLWKDEQNIKNSKTNFDKKLAELKNALLMLIMNYQLVEDNIMQLTTERDRLRQLAGTVQDPGERQHIGEKINELESELSQFETSRTEILERLKTALTVVDGQNYTEKLSHLFARAPNESATDAINNFALRSPAHTEQDREKIRTGLITITNVLNSPIVPGEKADRYLREFQPMIHLERAKTHGVVKKITFGLVGVGGLLGGAGTTVTVAALILGGFAAVSVIGWPIVVAAAGVGLVTMVGSLLYYRHIEKKQQKSVKKLAIATAQVSGMRTYLDEKINKTIAEKVHVLDTKNKRTLLEVAIRLEVHEKNFSDYKTQTIAHTQKIKSLLQEIKQFHTFPQTTLRSIKELEDEIKRDILLLQELAKQVDKTMIVNADYEKRKIQLLREVTSVLEEAQADEKSVVEVYETVNQTLHGSGLAAKAHEEVSLEQSGPSAAAKAEVKSQEEAVQPDEDNEPKSDLGHHE